MIPSRTLKPILLIAAVAGLADTAAAQSTCANCTSLSPIDSVKVKAESNTDRSSYANVNALASTGAAYGFLQISQYDAATPLPIPAGTYPVWCATSVSESVASRDFTVTTVLPVSTVRTYPSTTTYTYTSLILNQASYIMNHKAGTVADVQRAMWTLVGTVPRSALLSYPNALAMYDNAITYGSAAPGPGQKVAVLLLSPGNGVQNFFLEMDNCVTVGDRFWRDTNENNLQDSGEPGINGVTVNLRNLGTSQIVGTTITAPSPLDYPYLPYGTDGYYRFTGLCDGSYRIEFDAGQSAIAGVIPVIPETGNDRGVDSNQNPDGFTLSITRNPSVDWTHDFGFKGVPPVTATCATATGTVQVDYSSSIVVSGGVGPYTFTLTSGSLPAGLTLNTSTGEIKGKPTAAGSSSFTIQIKDSTNNSTGTTSISCTIVISNPPLGLKCPPVLSGQVNASYNSALIASGGDGNYTFTIDNGALPPGLDLNPATGAITGTPTTAGTFTFRIILRDGAGQSATTTCTIKIIPVNLTLTCPTATTATVGVSYASSLVATGGATPYTFSITGSLPSGLTLNPTSGAITGVPTASGAVTFTANVSDSAPSNAQSACTITVQPQIVITCPPPSAILNVSYSGSVSVTGGSGIFTYSVVDGALPSGLTLDAGSGTITGTPSQLGNFNYSIEVTDTRTGTKARTQCAIHVYNPPAASCSSISGVAGFAIAPVTLTATGGSGSPFTYLVSGLTAGLSADGAAISGTPSASVTASYNVRVRDSVGNVSSPVSCSLDVRPAPSVNCVAVTGVRGAPIQSAQLTVSGGLPNASYTFSATGLPAGVTITSGGLIGGTPQVSGTYSYVVTADDGQGHTASSTCSVTIDPPAVVPACASIAGVQGVALTAVQLTATGGVDQPNYTFSVNGLPDGVTVSPTGLVSGTPKASGTFNITITVNDGAGHTGSIKCTVLVAPPVVANCVNITAVEGSPIVPVQLTASGGVNGASYSFSVTGLPDGLTMTSAGLISGAPTVTGNFSYTVTVNDGQNHTGTSACSVTVAPAPPVTPTCANIAAIQGVPISPVQLTASGGVANATYTFSATGLPAGITMTPGGLIGGTPAASGISTYTVTVSDGKGHTASSSCTITVGPAPVRLSCAGGTGLVGTPYSSNLIASQGVAPYTYSIVAGALPDGLTLNPATGAITGIPAMVGSYTFTASVTDASGRAGYNSATTTCTIVIGAGYNTCGLTWGYWKNHLNNWPVDSLTMGGKLYGYTELLALLDMPVSGDTSINLAHQLIAAKLNVLNGTNASTDSGAIAAADALLATYTGRLPLGVSSAQMTTIATQLDTFNQDGLAQPGCSNGPAPMSVTCAASAGVVGSSYTSALFVTGGIGPYTFSVVSGSLPPGLTLNPDTGAIKGTPTAAGTYSFTIRVADSTNYDNTAVGVVTKTCSITISAPPTTPAATCVGITAVQGVAISPATIVANGGVAPYTFTATGLPSGVSISSTGTISGTPASSGTFTYTVTIKDANKNTGTLTCTMKVDPPATGPALTTGDTATIGYWNNKNGQALILACNGSASATQLGNWLATNFPVLFGPSASNNLTGKTNTQVAALFKQFFSVKGTKTDAQVMAGALAVYVTNSSLAGTVASKYGFTVSTTGTGARFFNVGANGAAVGLTNNTSYSIMRLLQNANAVAPYDANEFAALNVIFTGINETGDIK